MLLPPSAVGTAASHSLPPDAVPGSVRAVLLAGARPVTGYVYDLAVAHARATALREALPDWATLLFAVKANSHPRVLAALGSPGGVDGFEVASATEARLAAEVLSTRGTPSPTRRRLVAAGPAKHETLLRELLLAGVEVIHAESALELHRLSRVATGLGRRITVGLRVNPAAITLSGTLAMAGRSSAFGVPEPQVDDAVALARSLPGLDLAGFHVHAVCGNRDAAAHASYVAWCLSWASDTARAHGLDLRWLDVGGGLGVEYAGEDALDLDVLADELGRLRPPSGLEVAVEPGRWLAADCGFYAAEVVDVKESYGHTWVVVRGGINAFALPGTEDFPIPFAVLPVEDWPADLPRPGATGLVTVAGELCTPEDVLARDVEVDRVRAGDLVVFPRAGAYGWEFALGDFLGHPRAPRTALPLTPIDPLPTTRLPLEALR